MKWKDSLSINRRYLDSDELLPEARGPPVGDQGLLEDLLEPGVALHHDAVTLGDDVGEGSAGDTLPRTPPCQRPSS